MAKQKNNNHKNVLLILSGTAAVAFIMIGCLTWWAQSFVTTNVKNELVAQKIYFPEKGSPALDPAEFPDLQQYAGQLVDDGPKAKAYANGYIGRHLHEVAGGKTYSEISAEARKNPTDQKLAAQKQSLFQGETLRGLLLGNAYAFWTIGFIAKITSIVSFIAGGVTTVLFFYMYNRKN